MAIEPNEITSEEYNSRIAGWGSDVASKIRSSIRSLTNKGKGALVRSLRMKTGKDFGEINRIGYSFNHYGVFVHKGVGRGYIMQGGVVVRGYKPGKVLKAMALNSNKSLSSKVLTSGTINRKPKPWLNPVIDDNIETLANMVAEMRADQAVNATRIKIN
jgi:hypothetical protein